MVSLIYDYMAQHMQKVRPNQAKTNLLLKVDVWKGALAFFMQILQCTELQLSSYQETDTSFLLYIYEHEGEDNPAWKDTLQNSAATCQFLITISKYNKSGLQGTACENVEKLRSIQYHIQRKTKPMYASS